MRTMFSAALLFSAIIGFAASQAPAGVSLCDYYSAPLNTTNATAAQHQWITNFVITVFGGNRSVFDGTVVPGVLAAGTFNGTPVHLVQYFDGSLYSTDGSNGQAEAVNWLDDGGVVTLATGQIANSNTTNQYKVLTHFSNLFARVFKCSIIGTSNFTSTLQYTTLYSVHKFMSLSPHELGYFIEQVGLAAQAVGVTAEEATNLTQHMSQGLTYRCLPPSSLYPGGAVGPQSICTNPSCPLAPNADCAAYDFDNGTSPPPQAVDAAAVSSASASGTPSTTASSSTWTAAPTSHSSSHKKTVDIAVGVAVPVGVLAIAIIALLAWRSQRKMAALERRLQQVEGGGTNTRTVDSETRSISPFGVARESIRDSDMNEDTGAKTPRPTTAPHRPPSRDARLVPKL